ncbi:MAG: alanine--tRNA ligase [Kofleriaceae bacterium]|nr:alanine--tRNA ligase [Kofleriaceae bacterium]MBP6838862.1 alanine--tRNA ligase [Kofleriaceae bacterium]MBP9204097.1 alanine--tRNA ligase [Kofleriaceae bacterium]
MKAAQVRSAFLEFFAAHGHQVVSSSALVPANDPTLMFTNAGMVQFKDVFTGAETRGYKRATTSQKCVRAGGKHNDLDEVGRTPRHHTFFEMLGNFSFGDYFKEDAIGWAWQLLTGVYGIDTSRLVITVFGGDRDDQLGPDDEARAMWKRVTGFGDDRVIGLGKKDNFWAMGDTGPMGPCSEIHYWMGEGPPPPWPTTDPASWKGWLEVWNLVFMQFERRVAGGPLYPLPAPSIDTGAGLERMASVLQRVGSNYDTDLFAPILAEAAAVAGLRYGADPTRDTSLRVIADHARCSAFLIADGVFPDKGAREYVLRRIFRRAVRHGKLLGITEPFMHRVCDRVIDEMAPQYPELRQRRAVIAEVTLEEEKRFRATLDRGLELLDQEFIRLDAAGARQVPGKAIFTLYDTFGFPDDLTEIIAEERGYAVDKDGFRAELEAAKGKSRGTGSDQEAVATIYKSLASELGATTFTGYDGRGTRGEGVVRALVVDGERVPRAGVGARVAVVLDRGPFYAESGGQIGDAGVLELVGGARVRVDDTRKPAGDMFVLTGEVEAGAIAVGDAVVATVDDDRRERIRANHSATHLLHLALKQVLGEHVAQKGSLVGPDRLRFDFAHFSPMTEAQRRDVEDRVNAEIRRNVDSQIDVLPIDQARSKGAVAMFGEKYGDKVRVVRIGGDSLEFCGGTHVRRAGDIGLFKLVSEAGVAQGVRRIEAVTGAGALAHVRRLEDELARAGDRLKAPPFEVAARVDKLLAEARGLEKELGKLKGKLAAGGGGRDLLAEVVEVGGVRVLAVATEVDDAKVLRETGDGVRERLGSGVLVLVGTGGDEVRLLAMVSKDLTDKLHAGKLLGAVAEVLGGRAGGKPDMAQGGGKLADKVPEALALVRTLVAQQLG